MQGDMIGLVALYFILGIVRPRVVYVPLVIDILCVHLDDCSADVPGFGVPSNVIADFEFSSHDNSPPLFLR